MTLKQKAKIRYLKNRKRLVAYARAYRKKYPEKSRNCSRRWAKNNPEVKKSYLQRYYKKHKRKIKAYNSRWKKKNPDRVSAMQRKQRYGITAKGFEAFRLAQKNCCRICKKQFDKTPCVDHSHKTGAVRGLLCARCNRGLGMFGDSLKCVESAVTYLKETEK